MYTRFLRRLQLSEIVFLTPLVLRATIPDEWVVDEPLVYRDDNWGTFTVPPGTITDLASIPRALRSLPMLDPNGISRRPAVLHDYLYNSGGGSRFDKRLADELLRRALIDEGASRVVAHIYWRAVDWFGSSAWNKGHTGSIYLNR